MTNPPSIDWSGLKGELSHFLVDELSKLVNGAKADLEAFAVAISGDMMRALRDGNTELTQELRGQALALVEIHRLRAANAADNVIEQVLGIAMRVASLSLRSVIGFAV